MKQKILLLLAVFFGFIAFILSHSYLKGEKEKLMSDATTIYLIQMNKNKAAGEEIFKDDLQRIEVKRTKSDIATNREIPWQAVNNIVGRKLENSIKKGQTLQDSDLQLISQKNAGFTTVVRSGYRAISIPVDATSSVNNLIQPQDNVDVIGTFRFPDLKGDSAKDTVTLTILQNVKVLAVGSRYKGYNANPEGLSRGTYNTVTLMLLPHEVEMVVFASQKGRLSLSLRNYSETEIIEDTKAIDFRMLEEELPNYNKIRKNNQMRY